MAYPTLVSGSFSMPSDMFAAYKASGVDDPSDFAKIWDASRAASAADIYGTKPKVPDYNEVMQKTIDANIGNLGSIYNLGGKLNEWSDEQARLSMERNMPGYTANMAKWSANNADLLAGKVSPDTWNNIQQMGAERGIATGTPLSGSSNAAMLRALGLTSEQMKLQGAEQTARQIASTPLGVKFDYNQFLLQPNEMMKWEYLVNIIAAAPDPVAAGQNNMKQAVLGQMVGLLGSGGNRSGFQGYMNSGDWLWNTLPKGGSSSTTGGGTGGGKSVVDNVTNKYGPGSNAGAPSTAGGWGITYATDPSGATTNWGTSGNVPNSAYPINPSGTSDSNWWSDTYFTTDSPPYSPNQYLTTDSPPYGYPYGSLDYSGDYLWEGW